jgi:hypothetical protein
MFPDGRQGEDRPTEAKWPCRPVPKKGRPGAQGPPGPMGPPYRLDSPKCRSVVAITRRRGGGCIAVYQKRPSLARRRSRQAGPGSAGLAVKVGTGRRLAGSGAVTLPANDRDALWHMSPRGPGPASRESEHAPG